VPFSWWSSSNSKTRVCGTRNAGAAPVDHPIQRKRPGYPGRSPVATSAYFTEPGNARPLLVGSRSFRLGGKLRTSRAVVRVSGSRGTSLVPARRLFTIYGAQALGLMHSAFTGRNTDRPRGAQPLTPRQTTVQGDHHERAIAPILAVISALAESASGVRSYVALRCYPSHVLPNPRRDAWGFCV